MKVSKRRVTRVRLVGGLGSIVNCVIGSLAIGIAPASSNQATVKPVDRHSPINAPQEFSAVLSKTFDQFEYRPRAGRYFEGVLDRRGRRLGNCTVFARMIHDALTDREYLPRYLNVELRSPGRWQDAAHVVTIVTGPQGHDWVFDNRSSVVYTRSELVRYYHQQPRARVAGGQKRSWRHNVARQ